MPRFALPIMLAVLVSIITATHIRDNVRVANSRIAVMLDPVPTRPPLPVLAPDLTSIMVALAEDSAAVGGPAPVFATAAVISTWSTNSAQGFGDHVVREVKGLPERLT